MENYSKHALHEVKKLSDIVEGISETVSNIKLDAPSNTVWVNLDLTENDITNRIFRSWLDAKNWILANTEYSEGNLWQIMLPSGNVGYVTLYEGIRLGVTDGTVIENLSSSVTFYGDYNRLFKAYIAGAIINNLDLGGDYKCCALFNCVVNNVLAATSTAMYVANDTTFLGGDFENYEGAQTKCTYIPTLGDIDNLSLNGRFNELTLYDDAFELNCIEIDAQNSRIYVTSISGGLNIENCSCDDLSLSGYAKITNSSMGSITGTGTANITVKNSVVNDVVLEDTATLTHENSSIIGTATVAAGATLTRISEPYDNTISGLTATNVKDAIDELKAMIAPTPEQDSISVSPDTLTFVVEGETEDLTKILTVTSTGAYVVSDKPDWILATIEGEICTLIAEKNLTGVERSEKIMLVLSDNPYVSVEVIVTQAGE